MAVCVFLMLLYLILFLEPSLPVSPEMNATNEGNTIAGFSQLLSDPGYYFKEAINI